MPWLIIFKSVSAAAIIAVAGYLLLTARRELRALRAERRASRKRRRRVI